MAAFTGLLRKDFFVSRKWFITCLMAELLFLSIPFLIDAYTNAPFFIILVFLLILLMFHVFFLPAMLIQSLSFEGKSHIWLYNPQSSKKLLLSKVNVGLIYQLISQLLLTIIGVSLLFYFKENIHVEGTFIFKAVLLFNLYLIGTAIYFACWIIFYWSVYHLLGRYTKLKGLRWLILITIFIAYKIIRSLLENVDFVNQIINGWTISIDQKFKEVSTWSDILPSFVDIPIPMVIFNCLLALGLFFFSSWLLDRKIEV